MHVSVLLTHAADKSCQAIQACQSSILSNPNWHFVAPFVDRLYRGQRYLIFKCKSFFLLYAAAVPVSLLTAHYHHTLVERSTLEH